ncbi:hypothetical protein QK309_26280 [Klebsiella quasipneumoniae]|uniref:hypothetical protein n=1 Tax=Klebsiella pneumoniae complex TaxID=3390273 RepID=UPI000ADE295B|nr:MULTISPECIES: hypothetical protein [Klebsiella]MDI3219157.1 hypothetical protein [Klebsiella quasipneumoniae]CAA1288187.1 Uncharacterised protein [Klebsiella pneumoniae]SWB95629.1 Uncharacterised protein [Klebsiella pneumoniae]SWG38254.1 Uncharacterised protein [Klebsiella pneumoniae]SXA12115.1 Uncharacterised protein [Klebsiella pneumoniae]
MKNEIEQIALQNDMSIEFVTWFFNEKKVGCGNVWFMMMAAMWEGWKGRSIEMDKLAAENVALKKSAPAPFSKLMMEALDTYHSKAEDVPELAMLSAYVKLREGLKTPATDRIESGFKADGVAEREKTITFTAAKKRTQDGVALIAIGKPYKIHNDDVIGEFFIGERGRYGVITMDRLNYFATSDEYAWAFSLREGADK